MGIFNLHRLPIRLSDTATGEWTNYHNREKWIIRKKKQRHGYFKGHYSLQYKKDCGSNVKQTFFKTTEPNADGRTITVSNDSLLISTSACFQDGGTAIYKRK